MFYDIALYLALIVFCAGLIFRIFQWFKLDFVSNKENSIVSQKMGIVLVNILKTCFSVKIFHLCYSFVVDGLLQSRILKTSFLRWFMHICIFVGFMALIIMHVFDETFVVSFFDNDYSSTLNPYMFLRNLFGVLVIVGLVIALFRRFFTNRLKLQSNCGDYTLIFLIAVIIVSGFFLESAKIISEPVYNDMIEEYADIEEEDSDALKVYWAKDYGVIFSQMPDLSDNELYSNGEALNEDNCISCHTKPDAAFISYPIAKFTNAKFMKSFAIILNQQRADIVLFYIHFLFSFLALALLPFTKAFHLISTPLNMALHRTFKEPSKNAGALSVRRMVELDACVHCGACTAVCSVRPINIIQQNSNILPSEKIQAVKEMVKGNEEFSTNQLLLDGSSVCTDCFRCNDACPAGIDLQSIWIAAKNNLEQKGYHQPYNMVKQKTMNQWKDEFKKDDDAKVIKKDGLKEVNSVIGFIDDPEFFASCVQCTTCANVCPVVANSDGKSHDYGMSPQQIMNFLRLGLKDVTLIAGLVWNCTTCYMCQENCPQQIPVTDILFELRKQGFKKLNTLKSSE